MQHSPRDATEHMFGDRTPLVGSVIEVRLREMNQLVDALDPAPFCEKDLDRRAEDFIVESARELPRTGVLSLVVFLDGPTDTADDRIVGEAIRAHFARRSNLLRRELRQLLRRGLISLGIGVAFLATFFLMAQLISRLLGESHWATLFREGLLIVGWVAMWRPLEIFLYDWWPILGEQRLSDRLRTIPVRVLSSCRSELAGGQSRQSASEDIALARWEGEGGRLPMAERAPDQGLQS
jgi:hypothetical protein